MTQLFKSHLFENLLKKLHDSNEEMHPRDPSSLNNLINLPDEQFKKIVPMPNPACHFRLNGGFVLSDDTELDGNKPLCKLSPFEVQILSLFQGNESIGVIGKQLSEKFNLPYEETFQAAKKVFIRVSKLCLYVPVVN